MLCLCHPPTRPPAGADVSALEAAAAAGGKAAATKAVARSDSVLIVKNLPFSSSLEELETMFGAAGGSAGGGESRAQRRGGQAVFAPLPDQRAVLLLELGRPAGLQPALPAPVLPACLLAWLAD